MPSAQSAATTARVPAGSSGSDLVGGRAEHHQQRRAAAVGEHPHGTPDQRLAVQLDERLRPAHPPPGARREQQPGRSGYRLISVTGCT